MYYNNRKKWSGWDTFGNFLGILGVLAVLVAIASVIYLQFLYVSGDMSHDEYIRATGGARGIILVK